MRQIQENIVDMCLKSGVIDFSVYSPITFEAMKDAFFDNVEDEDNPDEDGAKGKLAFYYLYAISDLVKSDEFNNYLVKRNATPLRKIEKIHFESPNYVHFKKRQINSERSTEKNL